MTKLTTSTAPAALTALALIAYGLATPAGAEDLHVHQHANGPHDRHVHRHAGHGTHHVPQHDALWGISAESASWGPQRIGWTPEVGLRPPEKGPYHLKRKGLSLAETAMGTGRAPTKR